MRDGKRPVFLTTEQINTLQDMILEKQYQLAAACGSQSHNTVFLLPAEAK